MRDGGELDASELVLIYSCLCLYMHQTDLSRMLSAAAYLSKPAEVNGPDYFRGTPSADKRNISLSHLRVMNSLVYLPCRLC